MSDSERMSATLRALADAQAAAKAASKPFSTGEIAEVIVAANPDADYHTLMDVARSVGHRTGKGELWTRFLLDTVRSHAPAPPRRSAETLAADRQAILDYVAAQQERRYGSEVATRPWMRAVDLAALVKAGKLERIVRREYDAQKGNAANLFGGAGVMKRQRAYLRLPRR